MRILPLSLLGAAACLALGAINPANATPVNGTVGLSAGGVVSCAPSPLAAGATCSQTGVIFTGGSSGDFALIPAGTAVTQPTFQSSVGQTVSFTSADGNFTGTIGQVVLSGGGTNSLSLTDTVFSGTFTPAGTLSAFTAGPASLVLSYTESINPDNGGTTFSLSETLASPPNVSPPADVPEPTTMALLGSALLGFGVFRRRKPN